MLRQLITSLTARRAPPTRPAVLQPAEIKDILDSLPEMTRELRARQTSRQTPPPSVCTSLKDLCEL
jgi:hypothetical protein